MKDAGKRVQFYLQLFYNCVAKSLHIVIVAVTCKAK